MVNKMNGESLDLTEQNIARLKELFPEILTDGDKIDFDMLKTLLGEVVETEQERYQFTWHGKKKMIEGAQKPSKGTLRPVPEKSKNYDTTENLYIEGDNLEVLKLLQKSYNGKIKMIYIDPPYNTGQDFVYKDNYKDGVLNYLEQTGQVDCEGNILSTNTESNGRFHTDWLNMIYPRLKLARNLLTDDGVIFIAIDNNEIKNLRMICDEIFGESCFVEQLVWRNKYGSGAKTKAFIEVHEYILCYSRKPIINLTSELGDSERAKYTKVDERFNTRGGYRTQPLMTKSLATRENLIYPILYNGIEIWPTKQWVWSKERMENAIKNNLVEIKQKNDGSYTIESKSYLKDENGRFRRGKPVSLYNGPFNQEGTEEIRELFNGETPFDFVKPTKLVQNLLSLEINDSQENDFIVLDFFSGSSTTAHAVMNLNSIDGGKRKFIMVQIPEETNEKSDAFRLGYKNICEIGIERIKKAGEKIKQQLENNINEAGMINDHLVNPDEMDIGFKVLKLDSSNIREWNVDFENLEDELDLYETPFIDGRSELDIVYEIMLKQGLEPTYPIETFEVNGQTIYDIAFGSLFICLSHKITPDIAKAIIARRDGHGTETSSVIFSDAGFSNDSDKLNCIEILKDAGYPEDNLLTI
ncbi:site-specific DNA-methyltransferase [Lysinibacillus xylanilyticus]|uniref:site-specific DNA-methyltransferase n=1 Tax=Lysinibacillus xylanilyticus TaxID=582475 RepID=UPI003D04DCF1